MKKKRIKISSGKNKGRKLQQWAAKQISKITGLAYGRGELIESNPMGQPGTDIKLYAIAKEKFPFSVECKWQETWSIPAWIEQAKENQVKGTDWLLIIKKNHYKETVVMDAKIFFDIYDQYLMMLYGKNHKLNK